MVMSPVYRGMGASSSLLQSTAFLISFQAAESAAQVRFLLMVQLSCWLFVNAAGDAAQPCILTECICFSPDLKRSHAHVVIYHAMLQSEDAAVCNVKHYCFMQW